MNQEEVILTPKHSDSTHYTAHCNQIEPEGQW